MSVTRLKRKHRKNIARANNKQNNIKNLLRTPVLKNVDLDELKSRFGQTPVMAPGAKAKHEASLLETAKHAISDAAEKAAHLVSDAVDKVKEVADDVAHSDIVEKASHAVSDAVDKVKETVSGDDTAANAEAFDPADATRKPVNEDGQEGTHPKPEIEL